MTIILHEIARPLLPPDAQAEVDTALGGLEKLAKVRGIKINSEALHYPSVAVAVASIINTNQILIAKGAHDTYPFKVIDPTRNNTLMEVYDSAKSALKAAYDPKRSKKPALIILDYLSNEPALNAKFLYDEEDNVIPNMLLRVKQKMATELDTIFQPSTYKNPIPTILVTEEFNLMFGELKKKEERELEKRGITTIINKMELLRGDETAMQQLRDAIEVAYKAPKKIR